MVEAEDKATPIRADITVVTLDRMAPAMAMNGSIPIITRARSQPIAKATMMPVVHFRLERVFEQNSGQDYLG